MEKETKQKIDKIIKKIWYRNKDVVSIDDGFINKQWIYLSEKDIIFNRKFLEAVYKKIKDVSRTTFCWRIIFKTEEIVDYFYKLLKDDD